MKYDKILIGGHLGAGIGFMLGGWWVFTNGACSVVSFIGAGVAGVGAVIFVMSLKKVVGLFKK
ncbi:hypothetical protein KKA33_02765 [Patescibacteria group bacterium]|nr:hypothetical protein [Patescibacteria group bacterium]